MEKFIIEKMNVYTNTEKMRYVLALLNMKNERFLCFYIPFYPMGLFSLMSMDGFEPSTSGLKVRCSTSELHTLFS